MLQLSENKVLEAETIARQAETIAQQAETKVKQAETIAQQAETIAQQAETKVKQAETIAQQAETKAKQAETKVKQAETIAQQAETKAKQAEVMIQLSEMKSLDAEIKTQKAETMFQLSESKALEAETKLRQAENKEHQAELMLQFSESKVLEAVSISNKYKEQLSAVHNSSSWRITAFPRWLVSQCRLLRQYGLFVRFKALLKKLIIKLIPYVIARPKLKFFAIRLAYRLGIAERLRPFVRTTINQERVVSVQQLRSVRIMLALSNLSNESTQNPVTFLEVSDDVR
jgi:hypothetical protein